MRKEGKRPILTGKNAALMFFGIAVLYPFATDWHTSTRILKALSGGVVECPPTETALGTNAMVIADAGKSDTRGVIEPNDITMRTLHAAAEQYVERAYRNKAPDFVIMLNNPDPKTNWEYQLKLQRLVSYYSHKQIDIPDENFRFSNKQTTARGIDDLETILKSDSIRSVEWVAWPNQNRGAIEMCRRKIPTNTLDVNKTLESHISTQLAPFQLSPFQEWKSNMREKLKISAMYAGMGQ